MRLKIAHIGEPVLRDIARPLTQDEIGSNRIRELVEYMRETLSDAPGVGLAAPQVGEPLQLLIVEDKAEYQTGLTNDELKERDRKPVPFHVLINPRLELVTPSDLSFYEGCLSLPGFGAVVPRARKVIVDAFDDQGNAVHIEAEGWYSRILQHEIDHLNGTIYIDRMHSRSFSSMDNYTRFWKSKPIQTDAPSSLRIEL